MSQVLPPRTDQVRAPSPLDACIPVIALMVLLASSYLLYREKASQGPNQIALICCGLIAAGIATKNGMPWSGVRQAVVDGVSSGLTAIFILFAVGTLIGTWALSAP